MGTTGKSAGAGLDVSVPTILRDCVGGNHTVSIGATTLAEALQRLRDTYPLLRIHLYDESEQLRPHVLLFYNGESTRWLDTLDLPLRPGDRLEILQAVSGG
jgi:molybdopterin converting factor small subunit